MDYKELIEKCSQKIGEFVSIRGKGIPEHMHYGLAEYLVAGVPQGSFLMAVLKNDLKEAVARADLKNVDHLPEFVGFLYSHAPGNCWGSPGAVLQWIERKMEERETKRSEA